MFLAKHACSGGSAHAEDGNHAVYHHEILETLRGIGVSVVPADDFSALYDKPDVDFVFTLLNRAGFPMSEMLGPLLAQRRDLAFLGASPIVRGLSDDKHLMKSVASLRGVPVTPWMVVRRGALTVPQPDFEWEKLVVKPNASSASWGVGIFETWDEARAHVEELMAERHDVIVEAFAGTGDVVVPALGGDGPLILSTMRFEMDGATDNFRSYEEKRGLTDAPKERLVAIEDAELTARLHDYVERLMPELWPFDYGRFEFRHDADTGSLHFMEVNLSCNLWSKKTVSGAAQMLGMTHSQVVEHILAYSMERQGVIKAHRVAI